MTKGVTPGVLWGVLLPLLANASFCAAILSMGLANVRPSLSSDSRLGLRRPSRKEPVLLCVALLRREIPPAGDAAGDIIHLGVSGGVEPIKGSSPACIRPTLACNEAALFRKKRKPSLTRFFFH